MKKLYLKQAVFTLAERFTVTDEKENVHYTGEGSFFRIPKKFTVKNHRGKVTATITKEIFSLLPRFVVEYQGHPAVTIRKELSLFKPRYTISAQEIEVRGDWWDMNFEIYQNRRLVGKIRKRWLTWGDTYEIAIGEPVLEGLIISLVIAIDCVKADENAATASSS